jgi:hypothetical protein
MNYRIKLAMTALREALGDFDAMPVQSTNCFASRASEILRPRPRQNNPTGKSPKVCKVYLEKIFWFSEITNQSIFAPVSPDERGGSRVVMNARWDAVDARVPTDERGSSGR